MEFLNIKPHVLVKIHRYPKNCNRLMTIEVLAPNYLDNILS